MGIKIEEQDTSRRRLLKVHAKDVTIQSLIGDGTEYEVASRVIRRCNICGGKTVRAASGELLSPHKMLADEDGAYSSPHRHSKPRRKK